LPRQQQQQQGKSAKEWFKYIFVYHYVLYAHLNLDGNTLYAFLIDYFRPEGTPAGEAVRHDHGSLLCLGPSRRTPLAPPG
jgi:hypothetical protein